LPYRGRKSAFGHNKIKRSKIPEVIIAGKYLNCREVRNIVLDKCLLIFNVDWNSNSIGTPFIETIPEITQSEIFNCFSITWIP